MMCIHDSCVRGASNPPLPWLQHRRLPQPTTAYCHPGAVAVSCAALCWVLQRDRSNSSQSSAYFNPEEHIFEKREWSRRYMQGGAGKRDVGGSAPDRLFEHFAVVVRCVVCNDFYAALRWLLAMHW